MNNSPLSHEQLNAYYAGLRTGGDPEVLEDLGIPTSPESARSHIASAKEVAQVIGANNEAVDDQHEHQAVEKALGKVVCGDCMYIDCSGCK